MVENGTATIQNIERYFPPIRDRVNRASHDRFTSNHRPLFPAKRPFLHQPQQVYLTSRDVTNSQVVTSPFARVPADSQVSELLIDGQCFPRPHRPGYCNWRGSSKSAVLL